jgi:hypothetical protein
MRKARALAQQQINLVQPYCVTFGRTIVLLLLLLLLLSVRDVVVVVRAVVVAF